MTFAQDHMNGLYVMTRQTQRKRIIAAHKERVGEAPLHIRAKADAALEKFLQTFDQETRAGVEYSTTLNHLVDKLHRNLQQLP